ncbi:MAG: hypothetical protein HYY20_08120 [Candidatus Tectomicrobia bacterium]|uniref:Intracellular proteinase inhibitor BsuPI domain-containing protein n=1 Tax=Tectimicrobiota bacterium TaxID=2528274 RepID=A0A932CPM3_UNCTE|nr:hypothetical protein [Candidatus Tectomicrobia bacterium]
MTGRSQLWSLRFAAFLLAGCSLVSQPVRGKADPPRLRTVLTTDKATYAPGEPITFALRLINETAEPIRLSFTTAQRFDLVVQDPAGREVWRWSAGRFFAQALGEETLQPSGGDLLFQATLPKGLPPGTYTVHGTIPAQEHPLSASTRITVR